MSSKVIMFDIDGVLADFVLGFTFLANHMYGTPITKTIEQPRWDFSWCMTADQESKVWDVVKNSPMWWFSLSPLISKDIFKEINRLGTKDELLFCTNRFSNNVSAQLQSHNWLLGHGIESPNVICSKRKGEVAKAVNADYYIDDKPENVACAHWIADARPCRSYLINRPYNEKAVIPKRAKRVNTVVEFIQEIQK